MNLRLFTFISFTFLLTTSGFAQIDSSLLKRQAQDTSKLTMNMDAVYNRPFLSFGKLPIAFGGYVEANYQHLTTDGITEGSSFQMRRFTLFAASTVMKRVKFLTEIEFEDGAKEINIEFAAIDFELNPLVNFRGGIIMNPIGSFNQNHDGPKWEFVDRPVSATQMLPATWSNVGFGVYGKKFTGDWVLAYEGYLTNGFDNQIIENTKNKTFLPASKLNQERFEESFNGVPLMTGKAAIRHKKVGELGISYMGGVYNKFEEDGLTLDKRRHVDVFALDFNSVLPKLNTHLNGEFSWVWVDVPGSYTQQFGRKQKGGFLDIVQPVLRRPILDFEKSVINVAARLEYVDWNVGRFNENNQNIADDYWGISGAISWRPSAQSVIRFNYLYNWQQDILGNPPAKTGGFQFGISSYF
ncbi:hypothetical protein C3K47_11815 [Solitalea longa]|uniref:Porin n=1 Tax=Solitalea longa TaxID=2079460 RepID=A0A2S5A1N0_9SPHI|nr:hypothetical protein [Solitalea longa]POY36424.1 hypothetical protein C3K47_11815 [Solitalea longa]